ncbi:MAG: ABC transporter permease [Oscillospiraceae bacterium]|nr:ABC transporter permease [Oscillospiraceae bacterium]MBQ3224928.1 ABC transporter permease [Oscillospiraceae bacterium]MBQ6698250.1 ABC transporter permease [Oscillospiraceae bacterium]MBQ7053630.1 ABC transporter permease [Oscillospiraceae bacterium]
MYQCLKLALKSISGNKMRSFLTMLGVIIGIASVITLVSVVQGFSDDMVSSFNSMGTNNITVMLSGRGGNMNIKPEEMLTLADDNPELFSNVTPTVTISGATVKYGSTNVSSSVYGGNEEYAEIKDYAVSNGRFISYIDTTNRNYVCVIGTYIANELFGTSDPIGKILKINGSAYTIIGLLEEEGDSTETSTDNMVIIPYSTAARLARNGRISSYTYVAKDSTVIEPAKKVLEDYLYDIFEDEDAYNVSNLSELVESIEELTGTLAMVLAGIAAISLLVGGIGIMNIMLVSVTERTREIGIRKAIGGKRRDILSQFVIEAIITSGLGGVIGIIVGALLSQVLSGILGVSGAVSASAVILSFSVSVLIGVFFGYFPAAKASKLNPIDALRHD